jgi:hypothetical protein
LLFRAPLQTFTTMTEPTNPLFEDEKEFLERKKLEYERALLGDVEEIKEQTIQVGKMALVGVGVVGGIWLLVKAFSGGKAKKKHKHKKHRPAFDEYAGSGFDGYDEDDHELSNLDTDYQDPEYAYDHANSFADNTDDGFSFDGGEFGGVESSADVDEADDNGLSQYDDFPAHSAPSHGYEVASADVYHTDEDHGYDEDSNESFAPVDSYQARPYDDSRRLPESTSFAADNNTEAPEAATTPPATPKRSTVGPALLAFAKSETGRVITAQAAALALAFVTKAVQGFLPKYGEETDKNTDLAASSASPGISPEAWPATTAAQDASAAAHHDDLTPREPLA